MSPFFLPLLMVSVMAFGSIVLSCFTLLHARTLSRYNSRSGATQKHAEDLLEVLQARLESLSTDVEDCKNRPSPVPGPPKPSFNLNKRAQALRMHRRGDSPRQIAAALEIARQEVDLLLKVHQIVVGNL